MLSNHKLVSLFKRFDSLNKSALLVAIFGLELLIFCLDYVTGPLAPFTPFYLIPVALAALFLDSNLAYLISLLTVFAGIFVAQQIFTTYKYILVSFSIFSTSVIYFTVTFLILQLRKLLIELSDLANQDSLTKAYTRRHFYDTCNTELARSYRYKHPVALAFIDLDNFKEVNDTYGHQKGDQLLVNVAQSVKSDLREGDLFGRLGGDEFAILLNQTDMEQARIIVERIKENMQSSISSLDTNVTFSMGVVTYTAMHQINIDVLVAHADRAMYKVKQSTKDSIRFEEI